MRPIDHASYLALRTDAQVLEADWSGDKVLRLADGNILKLFRRKRLISSAAWYPYARRFADNCQALAVRQIPCPTILNVVRIPSIERDAVHYAPLPGHTLRQLIEAGTISDSLRVDVGQFIAHLHETGIYFRSAHLGNIVQTPEGDLGLIDVADLQHRNRPLHSTLRLRNFKHMLRYPQDRAWLLPEGDDHFLDGYLQGQRSVTREQLHKALRAQS